MEAQCSSYFTDNHTPNRNKYRSTIKDICKMFIFSTTNDWKEPQFNNSIIGNHIMVYSYNEYYTAIKRLKYATWNNILAFYKLSIEQKRHWRKILIWFIKSLKSSKVNLNFGSEDNCYPGKEANNKWGAQWSLYPYLDDGYKLCSFCENCQICTPTM